jgi:hypothetical protein
MKSVIVAKTVSLIIAMITGSAFAQSITAASAFSLSLAEPKVGLFVSYPGQLGDQCGLKLVVRDGYHVESQVVDKLLVRTGETVLEPSRSYTSVKYDFSEEVLGKQLYGIFVTVETKDGSDLSTLIEGGEELLIVSIPCPAETGAESK